MGVIIEIGFLLGRSTTAGSAQQQFNNNLLYRYVFTCTAGTFGELLPPFVVIPRQGHNQPSMIPLIPPLNEDYYYLLF